MNARRDCLALLLAGAAIARQPDGNRRTRQFRAEWRRVSGLLRETVPPPSPEAALTAVLDLLKSAGMGPADVVAVVNRHRLHQISTGDIPPEEVATVWLLSRLAPQGHA